MTVGYPDRKEAQVVAEQQAANIFWTGGWDSTYRVLDLVLTRKKPVQTYYVVDADRLSTGAELQTMRQIKQRLFAEHPEARELLLPMIIWDRTDLAPNDEVTQAMASIRSRHHLGGQYGWLARFAQEINVDDFEMGLFRNERWERIFGSMLEEMDVDGDPVYRIGDEFEGTDVHTIFRYFRLPIFHLSKPKLRSAAREKGFLDLMEMTWFCHRPRGACVPCGTCITCVNAIEWGMAWRLPWSSRMRYHLRIKPRIREFFEKHRGLHEFARGIKRKVRPTHRVSPGS